MSDAPDGWCEVAEDSLLDFEITSENGWSEPQTHWRSIREETLETRA